MAEHMGLWAVALRPRFVVGLGDNFNFYDVGVSLCTSRSLGLLCRSLLSRIYMGLLPSCRW